MAEFADRITQDIATALANDDLPLPMLPEVALRVREAADDPNTDARALADLLGEDPGLSARVIRMVNSPLVRSPVPIADLPGAVSRLGLAFTANLATGYAMQQMFQSTNAAIDTALRATWQHARDVAAVATVLCRHFTPLRTDLALLAGLTHAIGVLPVLAWVDEHHAADADPAALAQAIDGIHGELGAMIIKEWAFPEEICVVPRLYLDFDRSSPSVDYVDVVTVANLHTRAGSDHPHAQVDWSSVPAFHRLGLEQDLERSDGRTGELGAELDDELDATREALA